MAFHWYQVLLYGMKLKVAQLAEITHTYECHRVRTPNPQRGTLTNGLIYNKITIDYIYRPYIRYACISLVTRDNIAHYITQLSLWKNQTVLCTYRRKQHTQVFDVVKGAKCTIVNLAHE